MAQQFYIQIVESDTDTCDSDDSQQDPTFNILENTRSKLSNLSINKKSRPRVRVELDEDADSIEPTAPEFDANEEKSFKIVQKIIEGGQVEKLKVEQCKLYLRRHGLRLTGKKDILIQRINEHISIVNGEGEQKYPASSFVMNCKGDACTGDVVMFEQNVYELFNIASRSASGPPCGQRIVAGRIVKESYGAAKQQHTFTIEVLWSKGTKPLPPLHPLLIKGRNLYRLKTMRQRWEDESERQKILSEKHARGNVARSSREARLHEKEMKKALRENRASKGNIKNEKQQTKRKASPTCPINSQRTSIQSLGSTFMGGLGNCPSRGMDHEYHGASYKENMNLDNLRSIDGPSRGMHDTQRRAQDEENVKPNALKGIDGPPRGMHYTHRGAQDKEHVKPNALRGIDGPLRKSFHAEQNMRFYPPRHDYVMSHNTLRSTDSLLRRSFHVEQSMRFYPPTHDYDMNHNTLRGIDMGMDHKYQGSLSMGMDHGAPLRKSFQVERNMGFYPPKHDHDPRNVAESYSFQQASYLPRGHYQGKRQQLCRYYAQGGCHHGTNCKYLH